MGWGRSHILWSILSTSIRLGVAHRPADPEMKLGLAYGKGFRPAGQKGSSSPGLVLAQPCYTPEPRASQEFGLFLLPSFTGKGHFGKEESA